MKNIGTQIVMIFYNLNRSYYSKTRLIFEIYYYNSITDILVCEPNMRRKDYLFISQTGMSVVHFPKNKFLLIYHKYQRSYRK